MAGGGFWWQQNAAAADAGAGLYRGESPLPGRMVGFTSDLPTAVTRCANCHERPAVAAVNGGVATSLTDAAPDRPAFGAALDRSSLSTPRSRRGGPASVYDVDSLCTLLRTGVDPAQVMIGQAMPRYDATPLQCEQLWAYFQTR